MTETLRVEHLLGMLVERTDNIRKDLAEVKSSIARREAQGHEIELKLDALDERLGDVEESLAKASPIITDIEKWRERARGMAIMWGLGITAIGFVTAGFAKHLWTIIRPHLGLGG